MLYDLIVIGSGPAGQKAAVAAAKVGKKVVVVEEHSSLGGGCVHVGTLPSKSFRESIYRYSLGSRGTLGREVEHHVSESAKKAQVPDMKRLLRRKDRVVETESAVIQDQLRRNKIETINGRARLLTPNEVEVTSPKGKRTLKGAYIILAVGARPMSPTHLAVDGKTILDSDSILGLKKMPETLLVVGAGIIGCEYASMFSMAGTHVHMVDRRHEILASVDREIVDHLVERFNHQGMELHLEAEVKKVDHKRGMVEAHLSNGGKIKADCVLVAQGRAGNTQGLGLEAVGIKPDERGLLKVDKHFRTSVPNIYAVGDVIGVPALASTSMEQGRIASCHAFGIGETVMSDLYPYGIYTIPEISMVGVTEDELKNRKADYVAGKARYRELARGQIVGDEWGLLKLLVDKKTTKLLGVHCIGDNAAEIIHIGQAVMALGGDVRYFIQNVFNYPTLAEAYKTAAFSAVNQLKS